MAGLFGYRLSPESGATFQTLAALLDATMRGLVVMALSMLDLATHRTQASPFGAATRHEWSLAALGTASIASALLEPDPTIEWDDERLARLRQGLSRLTLPDR